MSLYNVLQRPIETHTVQSYAPRRPPANKRTCFITVSPGKLERGSFHSCWGSPKQPFSTFGDKHTRFYSQLSHFLGLWTWQRFFTSLTAGLYKLRTLKTQAELLGGVCIMCVSACVSTWLGRRVPKHLVKHNSESFMRVFLGEINLWITDWVKQSVFFAGHGPCLISQRPE